ESPHPAKGLWPPRIIDGVDKELQAKGLKKVELSEHPDLHVAYNSGVKERKTVEGFDYGYGRWRGPGNTTYQTYINQDATLVVDLVDASKKEIVWRGVAQDTLSDKSEKNQEKLNKGL